MDELTIGGVLVMALVLGIVEALKSFGVEGRASQGAALGLAWVFVALAKAIEQGLIPEPYLTWVTIAVTGLAGGLAAMGYYDLGVKRFLR